MNKYFYLIVTGLMILSSCEPRKFELDNNQISVSILPQKYFVEKIAKDYFKINVLIPAGASPASYEPSSRQMKEITKSVSYLRIGHIGFEQVWMDRLQKTNKKMKVSDLSKDIDFIKGEPVKHGDHFHEGGIDPHIWMSLESAKIIARNTLAALIDLDSTLSIAFTNNYVDFIEEINNIEFQIRELLSPYEGKEFLIYHPALSYFARDFGLVQHPLELDGKNPSPAHLKEIIDLSKEKGIKAIFIQKEFDKENAETLAKEIGGKIIQINPLAENWLKEIINTSEKIKDAFELSE